MRQKEGQDHLIQICIFFKELKNHVWGPDNTNRYLMSLV